MSKDIQQCIGELKQSPLFALSKCSNELAHTNFWAWLIEECIIDGENKFVELFIPGFYKDKHVFHKVTREEGNRDLTIYYDIEYGKKKEEKKVSCHIVENKIKTIPTKKQLIKYEDEIKDKMLTFFDSNSEQKRKVKKRFTGGTLTGIKNTLDNLPEQWTPLLYKEMAEKMDKIVLNAEKEKRNVPNKGIIKQYIKDINNISTIITTEVDRIGNDFILDLNGFNIKEDIESIKLGDILLKQIGCKYAQEIERELKKHEKELETDWGYPSVETAFNHKKVTITVVYKDTIIYKEKGNDKEKEIGRLGVQIEGNEFRIYGGPFHSSETIKNGLRQVEQRFLEEKWFEPYDANEKEKKIREKPTVMNCGKDKDYCCGYVTSNYIHLYQYWRIDMWMMNQEHNKQDLYEEIIEELKTAKEIINSGFSFR